MIITVPCRGINIKPSLKMSAVCVLQNIRGQLSSDTGLEGKMSWDGEHIFTQPECGKELKMLLAKFTAQKSVVNPRLAPNIFLPAR